ncbi:MAG: SMI1/KNR4 family protein [Alphaproteobacteria bacterium]|nr:SMI1/KNR4 family protein [Alphaproteobacteria bacterium]
MNQLLESLKQHGAFFAPATPTGQITILNMNLQKIRAAMLPNEFIKFYQICGGIKLGNGYIFGPNEYKTGRTHPIPDILAINQDLTNIPALRGKTVFGRNDLFWFAFDTSGTCVMMDNIGLQLLRKYNDIYRAIYECLAGGKI